MTENKGKVQMLKASDLRAMLTLALDGKMAVSNAADIVSNYIREGRVNVSLDSLKTLIAGLPAVEKKKIEAAYREQNKLPSFEFDQKTAQTSIETQVLDANFKAIPAAGEEPRSLVAMMKEHNLALKVHLSKRRAPHKKKEAKDE